MLGGVGVYDDTKWRDSVGQREQQHINIFIQTKIKCPVISSSHLLLSFISARTEISCFHHQVALGAHAASLVQE